jgi:hypothetical protein
MLKKIKLLGWGLLLFPMLIHATHTRYNNGSDDIEYIEDLEKHQKIDQAASVLVYGSGKPPHLSLEDQRTLRDAAFLFFTEDDHLITASPFATLWLYLFDKEDLKITQNSPIAEVLEQPEEHEAQVELKLLYKLFTRMQVRNIEIDFSCFPQELHRKFKTAIQENTFTKNIKSSNYVD